MQHFIETSRFRLIDMIDEIWCLLIGNFLLPSFFHDVNIWSQKAFGSTWNQNKYNIKLSQNQKNHPFSSIMDDAELSSLFICRRHVEVQITLFILTKYFVIWFWNLGISFLTGIMVASFLFLVVSNKGKRKIIRSGKKLLRFTPTDVTSKIG